MSSVEDVSSDSLETSATNSGSDTVSIVIKRPREDNNGNNFECTVSKHLTVGELKQLLEQKHPAHPAQHIQQLIYGGKILGDPERIECILSSSLYHVSETIKPVLYLVLKGEGSTKAEGNSGSSSTAGGNHIAEAQIQPQNVPQTTEGLSSPQAAQNTSTESAVTETMELQRMLQNYFSQLEVSLREWSRHLEQLADISGDIARGSSSSENSGFGNGTNVDAIHTASSETMQRSQESTSSQQRANPHGLDRNPSHDVRRREPVRQQPEMAAPVFQRGFVLQFQVDWQLLMKLIFLVLLLGQDGDPFRFYVLLFFAALVYLYQTGALSGIVARISSWLHSTAIVRPPTISRASDRTEELSERRTSRFRQIVRSIYLKIYVFLYSFICSLFPAWQPDAAERPRQHED